MTIDSRLHRIVTAQPYPLLFATISGAHLYRFGWCSQHLPVCFPFKHRSLSRIADPTPPPVSCPLRDVRFANRGPSLHSDFVMWIDDLALGKERIGPRETDAPAPRQ